MNVALIVSSVTLGMVYALLALSINIIYSSSKIVNFAQGEFMMLGGMLAVTVYSSHLLPYPLAFLVVALGGVILGLLFNGLIIFPLRKRNAPMMSIIMATVGAGIVLRIGASLVWGRIEHHVPSPFETESVSIFGTQVLLHNFFVIGISLIAFVLLWWFYKKTTYGLAFQAVAFDFQGAKLVGINIGIIIAISFAAGASLAGIAGLMLTPLTYASPWVSLTYSIKGFTAAIVGGLGSWQGAVIGGLALGIFDTFSARYLGTAWGLFITFMILIAVLYIRPYGLLGSLHASETDVI